MLRGMRKASSNWLGKSVMGAVVGFLVISFAIWGIGDIFRGFRPLDLCQDRQHRDLDRAIPQLYNDRLRLSRQFGRQITPNRPASSASTARSWPSSSPRSRSTSARARSARRLRCRDRHADHRRPEFPRPDRPVRPLPFEAVLRQAGFTEARYVAEQRRQMLRRQLGGTIVSGTIMPKATSRRPTAIRTSSARSNMC